MTDDLHDLRRAFADVEPPDLWPEIERRAELPAVGRTAAVQRRQWRLPAAVAAATLLIVAVLVGARGRGGSDESISAVGRSGSWTALDVPILNWHLEHPAGWHVQLFQDRCMVGESGAVITNLDRDLRRDVAEPATSGGKSDGCSTGWQLGSAPRTFAGVEVTYRAGGPAFAPDAHEPDTTRPLDIDAFERTDDITRYRTVTIGGEPRYAVRAWLGPDASADDTAAVKRLVASIAWRNNPSPPTTTSVSTVPTVPLESVDWSAVEYPFDCGATRQGSVGWRVGDVAYATPAPNVDLAVVLVTCNAGAGTPPTNLLVYDSASSTSTPHLAQTLVRSDDNWTATRISANQEQLTLPARGYSSADVPRCCPDVATSLTWQWNNGDYVPSGQPPAHYH